MLPVFVGCLIAYHETGEFRASHLVLAELIALFVLIATALANDYADVEADRLNRNFGAFSGGSRVIPHGLITRRHMGIAAIISGSVALSLSLIFVFFLKAHPVILGMNALGLFIGVEYSLPPLRINYRGWGELFVMGMYSVFSILFGYVAQRGLSCDQDIFFAAAPVAITMFLMILITEIPDLESDAVAGKKTLPVIAGTSMSYNVFLAGLIIFFVCIPLWYLAGTISRFTFFGLLASSPFGVALGVLSRSPQRTLPTSTAKLCGLALMLNVWVNIILSIRFWFDP